MASSPVQHASASVLMRQLTLDAGALCIEGGPLGQADRLANASGMTAVGAPPLVIPGCASSSAPAPPASPFSSAPSDLVLAFESLKAIEAPALSSPSGTTATTSACCSAEQPAPSPPTPPATAAAERFCGVNTSICVAQFRSECLSSVLSGIESQVPPALASQASACGPVSSSCPAHGVKAVCGKRNKMEDTFAVQPNFFDIPFSPTNDDVVDKLPTRIAVQLEQEGASPSSSVVPVSPSTAQSGSDADPSTACCSCNSSDGGMGDTLHFFGVYDGHGGCQAAEHCAKRLHHHLSEALAAVCGVLIADNNQLGCGDEGEGESPSAWPALPSAAARSVSGQGGQQVVAPAGPLDSADYQDLLTKNSVDSSNDEVELCDGSGRDSASGPTGFIRSGDRDADANDASSSSSDRSDRSISETAVSLSSLLEEALKDAFERTDAEFANDGCAAMVGSTALVALVGSKKIWLANCGDSRAVLCRGGKAIQLTDDHKPEREDEAERVEKAGGQVLYWNGHRVMGVLAMSRAIGDHGLRPYIIAEPEVSVVNRNEDDEFLLLASDGLWDVMANQEATNLTQRCFKRARDKGASRSAAVRIAAAVLTKAAIDRGSKDNVTVVIVDIKQNTGDAPASGSAAVPATATGATAGVFKARTDADVRAGADIGMAECAAASSAEQGASLGGRAPHADANDCGGIACA